jgi:hypothetical protein
MMPMMMNIGISVASKKHVEQHRVERREHAGSAALTGSGTPPVLPDPALDHGPAAITTVMVMKLFSRMNSTEMPSTPSGS